MSTSPNYENQREKGEIKQKVPSLSKLHWKHKQSKSNKMYRAQKPPKTSLNVNNSYEGETIEKKIRRIVNNKEPITDGAPLIYTERKNGVQPEYDIKTDRWEIAIDAMDKVAKSQIAKRQHRINEKEKTIGEKAKEGMTKEGETTTGESKA